MDTINFKQEMNLINGILSDVEILDLPWNEQEIAGFDWFMAVGAIHRLISAKELSENQKIEIEKIHVRIDLLKDKLVELNFENPFEKD